MLATFFLSLPLREPQRQEGTLVPTTKAVRTQHIHNHYCILLKYIDEEAMEKKRTLKRWTAEQLDGSKMFVPCIAGFGQHRTKQLTKPQARVHPMGGLSTINETQTQRVSECVWLCLFYPTRVVDKVESQMKLMQVASARETSV